MLTLPGCWVLTFLFFFFMIFSSQTMRNSFMDETFKPFITISLGLIASNEMRINVVVKRNLTC